MMKFAVLIEVGETKVDLRFTGMMFKRKIAILLFQADPILLIRYIGGHQTV